MDFISDDYILFYNIINFFSISFELILCLFDCCLYFCLLPACLFACGIFVNDQMFDDFDWNVILYILPICILYSNPCACFLYNVFSLNLHVSDDE